jgi:hypothetical protein
MVALTLTADEVDELRDIRDGVLGDLRMEIAGTDSAAFREGLKWRQMFLEKLLAALAQPAAPPLH